MFILARVDFPPTSREDGFMSYKNAGDPRVNIEESTFPAFRDAQHYIGFKNHKELLKNPELWIDLTFKKGSNKCLKLLKELNKKTYYKIFKHKTRYLWVKQDGDDWIVLAIFTKYALYEDLYIWLAEAIRNWTKSQDSKAKQELGPDDDFVSRDVRSFVAAPFWPELPVKPKRHPNEVVQKKKRGRPKKRRCRMPAYRPE